MPRSIPAVSTAPDRLVGARLLFPLALGLVVAGLLAIGRPASAQVLVASPDCGVPGQTTVQIRGSGWAEPDPPCEYVFYFDGVEVAPRQEDGLFGPPAASFTVPAGASPGRHIIKVELRISENQQLIQCRQVKFCVVSSERAPWHLENIGNNMFVRFDPADVCDVTPCKSIVLIQSINLMVQEGSDPPVIVPFAAAGRAYLDDSRVNGVTIDYLEGERDPYYGGADGAADGDGAPGSQSCDPNDPPTPARFVDTPNVDTSQLPLNARVILEFEVNAFCAEGDDRGDWLGKATWTWSKTQAGAITITPGTTDRNPPSGNFTSALSAWGSNAGHQFDLPPPQPPTSGGEPCQ